MKKSVVSFSVALVAAAAALPAMAQTCAGYPTGMMGLYFGGRADFPDGLNSFGAEAAFNAPGPLGVHGGVNVVSVEDVDDSAVDVFFVGASLDIASIATPIVGPSVSVCPVAEVAFSEDEGTSTLDVPIGLGIGANLGIPGIAAHGYAQPRVVFSKVDFDSDALDDVSETNFGLKFGAGLGLGLITVGAEVNHIFRDEADPVFAIRAGIKL